MQAYIVWVQSLIDTHPNSGTTSFRSILRSFSMFSRDSMSSPTRLSQQRSSRDEEHSQAETSRQNSTFQLVLRHFASFNETRLIWTQDISLDAFLQFLDLRVLVLWTSECWQSMWRSWISQRPKKDLKLSKWTISCDPTGHKFQSLQIPSEMQPRRAQKLWRYWEVLLVTTSFTK